MNKPNCIVNICFEKQMYSSDKFCKKHYDLDLEGHIGICTRRGCHHIIDRNLYRTCSDCIN